MVCPFACAQIYVPNAVLTFLFPQKGHPLSLDFRFFQLLGYVEHARRRRKTQSKKSAAETTNYLQKTTFPLMYFFSMLTLAFQPALNQHWYEHAPRLDNISYNACAGWWWRFGKLGNFKAPQNTFRGASNGGLWAPPRMEKPDQEPLRKVAFSNC